MGALICERGHEVPIILDDALVFSDDDRIEQMFDALNRAGRTQQVIVLPCRSRAFAALGGRQLSITAAAVVRHARAGGLRSVRNTRPVPWTGKPRHRHGPPGLTRTRVSYFRRTRAV